MVDDVCRSKSRTRWQFRLASGPQKAELAVALPNSSGRECDEDRQRFPLSPRERAWGEGEFLLQLQLFALSPRAVREMRLARAGVVDYGNAWLQEVIQGINTRKITNSGSLWHTNYLLFPIRKTRW